jgi:Protein of unknown function (DUF4089)
MRRKAKNKLTLKKMPLRTKPSANRVAKGARTRRTPVRHVDFIEDLMASGAQALGLTIEPSWRDSVKLNLRLVLDHAARVEAFPLADEAEPAPIFHA